MARPVTEQQERNRLEQARLYGAPLGDLLAEVAAVLHLRQAHIAKLLGLSAPMVSQLASGHRVKIGNPGAVARLQRMLSLTGEVRDGRVEAAQALAAMEQDNAEDHLLTRSSRAVSDQQGAAAVRRLLGAVATPEEVAEAAELVAAAHPALAEALLVYATGSEEEARAHYTRCTRGLAGSPAP